MKLSQNVDLYKDLFAQIARMDEEVDTTSPLAFCGAGICE